MDTNSYDLGNGAKSIVNMKQVTSNRFEIFIDEDDVSTTKVDMEVVPNTPMDIQVNGENDVQIMNGQQARGVLNIFVLAMNCYKDVSLVFWNIRGASNKCTWRHIDQGS